MARRALPLPWCAVFQATQGHGMPCVNQQRPSLDGLWATCPASVSSGYRAELHEGYFHSAYQSQIELQLRSTKGDSDRH